MYKSNGVSCRFDTRFIRFYLLSLCFRVCGNPMIPRDKITAGKKQRNLLFECKSFSLNIMYVPRNITQQ